jgi:dTDP-4-dehydrorhamnose 3,5-epimerase
MGMRIISMELPGVRIIEPTVHADRRGHLFEAYSQPRLAAAGIDCAFVQTNHSFSHAGVVRGIHYQLGTAQSKLVRAVRGRVFDVAVDLRQGSPTFGRWICALLSAENRRQIYIPAGYGHGLCALDESEVVYELSGLYSPAQEQGVVWNDPTLGIVWPVTEPVLSDRDLRLPMLAEMSADQLPRHYSEPSRGERSWPSFAELA